MVEIQFMPPSFLKSTHQYSFEKVSCLSTKLSTKKKKRKKFSSWSCHKNNIRCQNLHYSTHFFIPNNSAVYNFKNYTYFSNGGVDILNIFMTECTFQSRPINSQNTNY